MRFGAMDVVERFSRTVVGRKDWSNEGEPKVLGDWGGNVGRIGGLGLWKG